MFKQRGSIRGWSGSVPMTELEKQAKFRPTNNYALPVQWQKSLERPTNEDSQIVPKSH